MGELVHLTSVHSFQDVRVFHKECVSLKAAGFDVSLVAPAESDQMLKGINIVAIPKHNSRLRRFFSGSRDIYGKALSGNACIFHFHDPELIPVGMLLALKGEKVIYDVHEDVPKQILGKSWIVPWLRHPVSWSVALLEWLGTRLLFSAVVAATPTIASRFPRSKTALVQNFPIIDELVSDSPLPYDARPNNIVYVGGITRIRGVLENIKAFEHVQHDDCRFVMAGSFSDSCFEKECRALDGWGYVDYRGFLSRGGVKELLNSARAGLVLLHPRINYVDALPIKLFEYMAVGIPVIASDFPLWRTIVDGANCGILVDPMKPEQIAKAIDWLLDNPREARKMGERGRRAVLERYNWSLEEKKLIELYDKLNK